MKVKRKEILKQLQKASIAIPSTETVSQSNCYLFVDGKIITFDGEVMTTQKSILGDTVNGAILSKDFVKFLQRFTDDIVDITQNKTKLIIKGKEKEGGLSMVEKVTMPYDMVPSVEITGRINPKLSEKIKEACKICSTEASAGKLANVHINATIIESTDRNRIIHTKMKTGIKEDIMLRGDMVAKVCRFVWAKIKIEEAWVHVMTDDDMLISMLRTTGEYYPPNVLDPILTFEGASFTFPDNIEEALERAHITDEAEIVHSSWDFYVKVVINKKGMTVSSSTEGGYYKERIPLKHTGEDIEFHIHTQSLMDALRVSHEATLNSGAIRVASKSTIFVSTLRVV